MVTYTETGQTGQIITWDEGVYDQPDRVLLSCDLCGATVPATRTDLHTASHA